MPLPMESSQDLHECPLRKQDPEEKKEKSNKGKVKKFFISLWQRVSSKKKNKNNVLSRETISTNQIQNSAHENQPEPLLIPSSNISDKAACDQPTNEVLEKLPVKQKSSTGKFGKLKSLRRLFRKQKTGARKSSNVPQTTPWITEPPPDPSALPTCPLRRKGTKSEERIRNNKKVFPLLRIGDIRNLFLKRERFVDVSVKISEMEARNPAPSLNSERLFSLMSSPEQGTENAEDLEKSGKLDLVCNHDETDFKFGNSSTDCDFNVVGVFVSGQFDSLFHLQERQSQNSFVLKRRQGDLKKLSNAPNEIDAIRKTSGHPCFLKFYSSYVCELHAGNWEFAMLVEFFESKNLNQLRLSHSLSQMVVKYILFQLGIALKHLHSLKIIHCNVNLENILVNKELKIKLTDLGNCQRGPYSNSVQETLEYMAPEITLQKTGRPRLYSYNVDYYAVGAVLYDILYGHPLSKTNAFLDAIKIVLLYSTQQKEEASDQRLPMKHYGYQADITREDITFAAKLLNYCPGARPDDESYLSDSYFDSLSQDLKESIQ